MRHSCVCYLWAELYAQSDMLAVHVVHPLAAEVLVLSQERSSATGRAASGIAAAVGLAPMPLIALTEVVLRQIL